jgi:hypothetical protein
MEIKLLNGIDLDTSCGRAQHTLTQDGSVDHELPSMHMHAWEYIVSEWVR